MGIKSQMTDDHEDEGQAWAKAFAGQIVRPADPNKFTPKEQSIYDQMYAQFKADGDAASLKKLENMKGDPKAFRLAIS